MARRYSHGVIGVCKEGLVANARYLYTLSELFVKERNMYVRRGVDGALNPPIIEY